MAPGAALTNSPTRVTKGGSAATMALARSTVTARGLSA